VTHIGNRANSRDAGIVNQSIQAAPGSAEVATAAATSAGWVTSKRRAARS